jgi:hypothetical protein
MPDPLRLPLVSGRTSWEDRVRFTAALLPLLVLISLVFLIWVPAFDGLSDLPLIGGVFAVLQFTPVFAAIALLTVAFKSRAHALANRPADLLVAADRVEVRGGAFDGLVLDQDELASLALVETKRDDRGFVEGLRELLSDRRALESCLELRTSLRLLAEAVAPDEQRTLRAVHQMLVDLAAPAPDAAGPAAGRGVEELTCPACGAPASPDDRPTVTCAACQASVAMPAALRDRVRAGRLATAASGLRKRAVADMTALPDARRTGRELRLLGWLMLLAWPALLLGPWLAGLELTFTVFMVVLAIGVGLDVAIYYAFLPRFIVRQAFPVALRQFAARAGAQDQACCRQCSAPLPPATTTVVRCAFCDTDNLLGRNLVRALPALDREVNDLTPAARAWRDDRRRSRIASAIAAAVLVGGATLAALELPAWRLSSLLHRCEDADGAACETLGPARWRPILEHQCYGAPAEIFACWQLARLTPDPAQLERALRRSCELRADPTCAEAATPCAMRPDARACAK